MAEQSPVDPTTDPTQAISPDELFTQLHAEQHGADAAGQSGRTTRAAGRLSLRGMLQRRQDHKAIHAGNAHAAGEHALDARQGYLAVTYPRQAAESAREAGDEPKPFPARKSADQNAANLLNKVEGSLSPDPKTQGDRIPLYPMRPATNRKGQVKTDDSGQAIMVPHKGIGAHAFPGHRAADKFMPKGQTARERAESAAKELYRNVIEAENTEYLHRHPDTNIDPELLTRNWDRVLLPANVLAFRTALADNARPGFREHTLRLLRNGGIRSVNAPKLIAAYLGVPAEVVIRERQSTQEHVLPPALIDRLNFMLKLSDDVLERAQEAYAEEQRRIADDDPSGNDDPMGRYNQALADQEEAGRDLGEIMRSAGSGLITVNPLAGNSTGRRRRPTIFEDPDNILLDGSEVAVRTKRGGERTRPKSAATSSTASERKSRARQEVPKNFRNYYRDLFDDKTLGEASIAVADSLSDFMKNRTTQGPLTEDELAEIADERKYILKGFVLEGAGNDAPQELHDAFASDLELFELTQAAEDTDDSDSTETAKDAVESDSAETTSIRSAHPELFEDDVLADLDEQNRLEIREYMRSRPSTYGMSDAQKAAADKEDRIEKKRIRNKNVKDYLSTDFGSNPPEDLVEEILVALNDPDRKERARLAAESAPTTGQPEESADSTTEAETTAEAHDYANDPFYKRFFEKEPIAELQNFVAPEIEIRLKWAKNSRGVETLPNDVAEAIKQEVSDQKTIEFLGGKDANPDAFDPELIRQLTKRRLDIFEPKTKHASKP